MNADNPLYLLDVTGGLVRKLIEYLESVTVVLGRPPERRSIFPQNYPFDFPRMRVSVQLSEERLRYDEARKKEMERAAGYWSAGKEESIYSRRSAEEYEEQAKRKVVQDWEKVRGDIYKPNHKRAVILGDPGFGKSWLLRYEGQQLALAEAARLRNSQVGTSDVIIPVFARLTALADEKLVSLSLVQRLEVVLKEQAQLNAIPFPAELCNLAMDKIANGQALLLLDGWDEVRENKKQLKEAIEAFAEANNNRRLYLTSRIAGYDAISLDKSSTKEWELVSFTNEQVKSFVQSYFRSEQTPDAKSNGHGEKGTALLNLLQQSPQVMGLARIPLMLALLCRIAWEKKPDDKLPTRRVDIYEQCLWGFVYKWKYQRQQGSKSPEGTRIRKAKRTLFLLSDISLRLFLENTNTDAWDDLNLADAIKKTRGAPRKDEAIDTLIDELEVDGVLVREGDDKQSKLRFIHRTFQEYLAANAIANRANLDNGSGWETSRIDVNGKHVTIEDLIDAKSWNGGWEEVVILLAGKLNNPEQLLELLRDPKTDDKLRHRVCLAALCLGEVQLDENRPLVDEIADKVFELWRSGACSRDINREFTQGASASTKVIDYLLGLLHDKIAFVRFRVAEALGKVGQTTANRCKIIDSLLDLLIHEDDKQVRYSVAIAVGMLDPALAGDLIVFRVLWGLLCERPSLSRVYAALSVLDQAAPNDSRVADLLLNHLAAQSELGGGDAAWVLGFLGQVVSDNPKVIEGRLDRLRAGHFVPFLVGTLGNLSEGATEPAKIIDPLFGLLHDKEDSGRIHAVEALGKAGQAAADKSKIIDTLLGLLGDDNSKMRSSAADALGTLGPPPVYHPKIIDSLLGLLHDKIDEVRLCAAEALGKVGQTTPDKAKIIDALLGLIHDDNGAIRSSAAKAVGILDLPPVYHPKIIDSLLGLLHDKIDEVRLCAAEALGKVGQTTPDKAKIIDALLGLIHDDNGAIRSSAAKAVGKLDLPPVYHPKIIDSLLGLLHEKLYYVRLSAVDALGKVGQTTANKCKIINALLGLIDNSNPRFGAAEFLEEFHRRGERDRVGAYNVDVLLATSDAFNDIVRASAADALERLGVRLFEKDQTHYPWKRIAELSQT